MAQTPPQRGDADDLPFRISLEAANRTVGLIALGLPLALLGVAALGRTCPGINSISHYYYTPLGGDILVGALCVIGVVMLFLYKAPVTRGDGHLAVKGYRGHTWRDIWLARAAGLCAFGVALAPTTRMGCEDFENGATRVFMVDTTGGMTSGQTAAGTVVFDLWQTLGVSVQVVTMTHYASAALMFAILAYYALRVFTRDQDTGLPATPPKYTAKWWRNAVYIACGWVILACLIALVAQFVAFFVLGLNGAETWWNARDLTFWIESAALVAFGISWAVKGRIFGMRDKGEANPRKPASAQPAPPHPVPPADSAAPQGIEA